MDFLSFSPEPNANWFRQVLTGQVMPSKVPIAELYIDPEMKSQISENALGFKWITPDSDRESQEAYIDNYIQIHYRLGYDYVRFAPKPYFQGAECHTSQDSAVLSRGSRIWMEEDTGLISTWEDFDRYVWPSVEDVDLWEYEYGCSRVPEGMGVLLCPTWGVLDVALHFIFGFKNLCFLLYDNPELVSAVFDRIGSFIYDLHRELVDFPNVFGFFFNDDFGFKTSTHFSPALLRQYVLPWHKKMARLAHKKDLLYILHCCGNIESIMEDLIDDVQIDAKHSFEDEIMPVTTAYRKYADRIGILGGVDVNQLCVLEEKELRRYVRSILDVCMEKGRYALGTGNSVANYVPLKNYLIMIDEGVNWRRR